MTPCTPSRPRHRSSALPCSSSYTVGSRASFASISRGGGGGGIVRIPPRQIVSDSSSKSTILSNESLITPKRVKISGDYYPMMFRTSVPPSPPSLTRTHRKRLGSGSFNINEGNFGSPSIVSVLGSSSQNTSFGCDLASKDKIFKRRKYTEELSSIILSTRKRSRLGISSSNRHSNSTINKNAILPSISNESLSTPTRVKTSSGYYPEITYRTSGPPSPPSLTRTHRKKLGSISFNINERTPETKITVASSISSNNDRFIPNRSQMRVDLCRSNVLFADKRRIAAIEKKVIERSTGEIDGPNNSPGSPHTPSEVASSAATETLTPLQSEFHARMRGALLSIPIGDVGSRTPNRTSSSRSNTSTGVEVTTPTHTINGTVTPNLSSRKYTSNLAYSNLNNADCGSGRCSLSRPSDPAHVVASRVLSFRSSSAGDGSFPLSPFDGGNGISVSSSSTLNRKNERPKGISRVVSPHPYIHDQLHVLHRSATSYMMGGISDHSSFGDVAPRSVANKVTRRINTAPSRILDAPKLVDDYYLNLISWGKDNILAVALGQCVYLWNAATRDIKHLLTLPGSEDFVTSVQWADTESSINYIAVGTNAGPVQLWDAHAVKQVRTLEGHTARVGSLSWNQHWLSSGGRDSVIIQHDHRSSNHIVSTYGGHTQEVCGLKWNEDGTTLASGGNENYLCLWDAAMSRRNSNERGSEGRNHESPRLILTQHQAAVKALAWCPFHRGLLASGGGTADRTIKFWNSNSGALLNSVDTGSQVCSLLWSKHQQELCSSHGFSENQLILWRYPRMTKIQEFKGHTARVLHMDQSPDGSCVVSAAADETLRFWDVFGSPPNKKNDTVAMGQFSNRTSLLR